VELSDDEEEVVIIKQSDQLRPKRQVDDNEDINPRPLQRQRSQPENPSTPRRLSPFSTPFDYDTPISSSPVSLLSKSPSITSTSPRPALPIPPLDDIRIPETSKPWPAQMYAVDMACGFHHIDKLGHRTKLESRLVNVFGRKIPTTTYHDNRRYWNALTEKERARFIQAGHTERGLWSTVPKASRK